MNLRYMENGYGGNRRTPVVTHLFHEESRRGQKICRRECKEVNPIESLDENALLLRLRDHEHDFVERKPRNQKGDWLQTAFALANPRHELARCSLRRCGL